MKFQSLVLFGLVAVLLSAAKSTAEEKSECPTDMKEFGKTNKCLCYPALRSIICEEVREAFVLKNTYNLGSLILKNINNLPLLTEKFHTDKKLVVDSLIILNEKKPTGTFKLSSMDDLEELFSISTEAIKIISTQETKSDLDVTKLSPKMESIVIQNAKTLSGFDINNFPLLNHLVIQNVEFDEPKEMQLVRNTQLKYLEISDSKNFVSLHSFKPASCAGEKIQIKLTNNKNMSYFDFTQLFVSKCKYHIDLSDNDKLDNDVLTRQFPSFKKDADLQKNIKIFNTKLDQLYLVMRDSKVKCNCNLLNAFHQRPANFHSIECAKVLGGHDAYLSDLDVAAKVAELKTKNVDNFKDCELNEVIAKA